MGRYLIVPGLNGSGPGHWQHYWLDDVADSLLVEQALWSRADEHDWFTTLEEAVIRNSGAILVAHSLGCLLAARLASSPAAEHVAGAMLVAPCDIGRTRELHPGALDFETMPKAPLPFPSVVVASRDDPYMRFATATALAERWGSGFLDMGEAGHINVASGFGRWPEGYALASGLERSLPRPVPAPAGHARAESAARFTL